MDKPPPDDFDPYGHMIRLLPFLLLAGCAGNRAMSTHGPIQAICEIPVCEKVNKRDKECVREYCMSRRELENMTRVMR